MWGAVAGAAIGAAGSIIGGSISSRAQSKALRAQQKAIQKLKKENADWYNRKYNEDATARADAQRAITRAEEAIKRRNEAAAGTVAVMGGSQDAVIAAQEANNKTLADISSQIAVASEARKDEIEQEYRNKKDSYELQEVGLQAQATQQRAQNMAQATQALFGAAGNIAGAYIGNYMGNSSINSSISNGGGITGGGK